MSLILAINTASQENALALIEGEISGDKRLLNEISWKAQHSEAEELLPSIMALLEKEKKEWKDLSALVVVAGPGPYTSLRVGITMANTISWMLKIPMMSMNVFELWRNQIKSSDDQKSALIAIKAGSQHYFVENEIERCTLEEIEARKITCYGEIPKESKLYGAEVKSFGEGVMGMNWSGMSVEERVKPLYVRPPAITLSKKK
jgi:tRNA threonylcarbamoyl adenosine modification protein YeaZ